MSASAAAVPSETEVAPPLREGIPTKVDLFGVQVTPVGPHEAVSVVMGWARERRAASVDFLGAHGVSLAQRDGDYKRRLNQIDLMVCDGQPIRWALNRFHKAGVPERVYGPATTLAVCRAAEAEGVPVYFYGSRTETLERLTTRLLEQFPKLKIAGAESPPFRALTEAERHATVDRINQSGAGVVFIGLGCPKQVQFATDTGDSIKAVQLCVGAAFDFLAGTLPMAPRWMQNAGLEWFYRLCREPRRLWKRYLVANSVFIALCLKRSVVKPRASSRQISESMKQVVARAIDAAHDADEHVPVGTTRVSVVVPMYNEAECASALVASLRDLAERMNAQFQFEFILVDDGSTDDTVARLRQETAGQANFSIVEHGVNRGIAAAIHTGLGAARNEIVVSIDSDLSYDPALMPDMIALLGPGVDLVTASPYHSGGGVEDVPRWRLRLSQLASRLYGMACGERLTCYTSCYRVYRRSAAAPLELKNDGFVGIAELLWKIIDQGGGVEEHPAVLRGRVAGQSKMRVVRAGVNHVRHMASIVGQRAVGRVKRWGAPRRRRSKRS
jgi:exopolysaccharide biosynthesis WecB/TagA/CpsF family protein